MVRYLHPSDHNPRRITKADKDFLKRNDFKDTEFPVKIRDILKMEKKALSPLAFLVMKTIKNIANNNIRSVILEIKNDRCKIVQILTFPSLSREHFQTSNKISTVLLFVIKTISLT